MKKHLARFASLLLVLAVFYFLGRALHDHWQEIKNYDLNFDVARLLIASLVYVISMGIFGLGWYVILGFVHCRVPLVLTMLYFFITQPAKYIPGKVWIGVTRMKLCKPHGVPNSVTILTTGLEAVIEIFAGTYISMILGLAYVRSYLDGIGISPDIAIFALSAVGLILLIPQVFYFFINRYLILVKQSPLERARWVSFPKLFLLQLLYIAGMLCFGISHALFLRSFAPLDPSHFSLITSIASFSYVAGILFLISPGGLGVREGIWYVALKQITLPHVALIFSIVSRIWSIIIEAVLLAISLPILWHIRKRERAKNTPPL